MMEDQIRSNHDIALSLSVIFFSPFSFLQQFLSTFYLDIHCVGVTVTATGTFLRLGENLLFEMNIFCYFCRKTGSGDLNFRYKNVK